MLEARGDVRARRSGGAGCRGECVAEMVEVFKAQVDVPSSGLRHVTGAGLMVVSTGTLDLTIGMKVFTLALD